jgi:hypothetical protein
LNPSPRSTSMCSLMMLIGFGPSTMASIGYMRYRVQCLN